MFNASLLFSFQFEVPAAFLDWQGLMDHSTDDLVEALLIWKHSTLCGRVIVLATITDEGRLTT